MLDNLQDKFILDNRFNTVAEHLRTQHPFIELVPVADVCRKHGVSDASFYTWRRKYGGMNVSEVKRLKRLEEENRQLKRLLAETMLEKAALEDVVQNKL